MKQFLLCLSLLAASLNIPAYAQSTVRTEEFSTINGVIANDAFKVTIKSGDKCKIDMDVDKKISDYCRCYLQGTVLYLEFNTKAIPRELRSAIKKDESSLHLNAIITVPAGYIETIGMSDKSVLLSIDTETFAKNVRIQASDNSSINAITVKEADKVEIDMKNKSGIAAVISAGNVSLSTANNSIANVSIDAPVATVVADNNSQCSLNLNVPELFVKCSGTSKITSSGTAQKIDVNGKGLSSFDATDLQTEVVDVKLNGGSCDVKPAKSLNLNDISGNGKVNFYGSPTISINRISNSSVTKLSKKK